MTQTGLSLGTPQYMSPEQAMGERTIDARSDSYALGAVTYEMLVGEAPFTGPSVQAIVARVLTEEPRAINVQRKAVPGGVEYAVMRALEKLPADRFASAAEFATALTTASVPTVVVAASAVAVARPLARDPRTWVTLAAVAASLVLATLYTSQPRAVASAEVRQQATFSGRARSPAISADGRFLAYLERRCPVAPAIGGCMHLMVVEVGGTRPVEVVTGAERLSWPRWTHDGLAIVFGGSLAAARSGLFLVPRLGGIPRRLADEPVAYDTHAAADSVAMVCARDSGLTLEVLPLSSGKASSVRMSVATPPSNIAWSPDGRIVALADHDTLRVVGRDGRVTSTRTWQRMRAPMRWSAHGRTLLGLRWDAGVNDDLLAFAVDDAGRVGAPQLLLSQVPTLYLGEFDVARSTGRIAVGSGFEFSDVWSFDVSAGVVRAATRHTQGTSWHGGVALAADGRALYSLRTDQLGNSLYRIVDGVETALTAEPQMVDNSLRLSLDERTISFESSIDSTPVLMMHDVAAGTTRHVPRVETDRGWFLSGANRILWWNIARGQLWTTDANGGGRKELTARPGATVGSDSWGLSPLGDAVVTASRTREATVIEVLLLASGPAKELARFPVSAGQVGIATWARDGTIYVARRDVEEHRTTFIGLDAASGVRRPGFVLPVTCDERAVSFAPAAGRVACTANDRRFDLTIIDGIRP